MYIYIYVYIYIYIYILQRNDCTSIIQTYIKLTSSDFKSRSTKFCFPKLFLKISKETT